MPGKTRRLRKDGQERKDTRALCPGAPTSNLAFPPEETQPDDESRLAIPITITELVVFLNNWAVRTYPGAFRCASNGVSMQIVADMINYHRTPGNKGPVTRSPFGHALATAIRSGRLHTYSTLKNGVIVPTKWTFTLHQKESTKDFHGPWDENKLTLTGFRHDGHSSHSKTENVSFASLASGVQRLPSVERGDGLNLTRCVQYAIAHPQEDLRFPRDFKRLTYQLGRLPVGPEHYDHATVTRWNIGIPNPPGRIIVPQPQASAALPVNRLTVPNLSLKVTQSAAAPPVQPDHLPQASGQLGAIELPSQIVPYHLADFSVQRTASSFHGVSQQHMSPYASTSNSITSGISYSLQTPSSETLQARTAEESLAPSPMPDFGRPSDRMLSLAAPPSSRSQDTAHASKSSTPLTRTPDGPVLDGPPRHTLATMNGKGTSRVRKREQDFFDDIFELPTKKQRHDTVPTINESDPVAAPGWTLSPAASFLVEFWATPSAQYQPPVTNVPRPLAAAQLVNTANTAGSHTADWARQSSHFAGFESFDMWMDSLASNPGTTTGTFLPSINEPGSGDDLFVPLPSDPVDPALTDYSLGPGFQMTINDSHSDMTSWDTNLATNILQDFVTDNFGSEFFDTRDPTFALTEDLDAFLARYFA
jgi:hypothetical protein